jgi:hypothetical protein
MNRRSQYAVRVGFLAILLVAAGAIGWSFATAAESDRNTVDEPSSLAGMASTLVGGGSPAPDVRRLETSHNGSGELGPITLVTTQGYYTPDAFPQLVALSGNGTALYRDTTYDAYFDVDPVTNESHTVEYVAAAHRSDDCPDGTSSCTRNVVVRANLTADTERVVYAEVTPSIEATRWHDVDRINDTHLLVADIAADEVFAVDTRTDEVTWRWEASGHYDGSGDPGDDWTHLNDVELLDDGRVLVSIRNMNEVLFVDPGEGVQTDWTLGEQDDPGIIDEQHNPDYIPAERGGPALVVADSQNNRLVEYQRRDGAWERTWRFQDTEMQWPRDADRLPNGNTLVTDTNSNRVVEISPNGSIVRELAIGMPYDVERLGTGDESSGGESMARLQGTTVVEDGEELVTSPDRGRFAAAWVWLKDVVPSRVANGLLYVAPAWVGFSDLVFAFLLVLIGLCWGSVELYWSRYDPVAALRGLTGRFVS